MSTRSINLKPLVRLLFVLVMSVGVVVVSSGSADAMEPLDQTELSDVTAQEGGLSLALENFKLTGQHTISLRDVEKADQLTEDNSVDNLKSTVDDMGSLILSNLSITGSNGDGGVNLGGINDPFTVDADGSGNGFLVLDFPENGNSMDDFDLEFGEAWLKDASHNGGHPAKVASRISILNSKWTGGSYLAIGAVDGGGVKLAFETALDADVVIGSPKPENPLTLSEFRIAGKCIDNGTNNDPGTGGPCSAADYINDDYSISGKFQWASLHRGRPIHVNTFTENGQPKFEIEFNPKNKVPNDGFKGVIAVKNISFGVNKDDSLPGVTDNYMSIGEFLLQGVSFNHFRITGPEPIKPTFNGSNNVQHCGNECFGSIVPNS